jgi:competence protein ComEA
MKLSPAFFAAIVCFPSQAQDLPDGPGKAAVEKVCSDCHGLTTIVGLRRTKSDWESTVDEMAARGAQGTEKEFDAVVEYLARYFGKVNVNKATMGELQEVLEIPVEQAEAIVKYRSANGAFKDLDALKKVPGLDAKKLDACKDRVAFM